jgi:OFA family oxalate/formate antiporter-like MFS transporter
MALSFFAAGVAFFFMPYISTLGGICVLALIIGLAFGTLFAVSAPLVTDCFGLKHFGAIFGLIFTAYGFVASVLGPALSGYLLDGKTTFFGVFAYLGVLAAAAGVLISLVAPPRVVMVEEKVLTTVPDIGLT